MCKIETILYKAFYVLEQFVEMKLVLYSLILINCILLSRNKKRRSLLSSQSMVGSTNKNIAEQVFTQNSYCCEIVYR